MSTNRLQAKRGWCDPTKLQKGPNSRNLCRRCGEECPKRNQTFCSKECVHEWRLRTDPGYVRHTVLERDNGICAICGVDTYLAEESPGTWRQAQGSGHLWHADHIIPVVEGGGECGIDNYRTLCVACHKIETAKLRRRLAAAKRTAPLFDQKAAS